MSYPGARIVILCCFLVHFTWISTSFFVLQLSSNDLLTLIACEQSFAYLCYPVFGWLADTRFTRYSMIRVSVVLLMVTTLLGVVLTATTIIVYYFNSVAIISGVTWYTFLFISVPQTIGIAALGMFEANTIQFGMDQMLEATSDQLSAFIHWYYWSIQLSRGLLISVSVSTDTVLHSCGIDLHIENRDETQLLPAMYILLPVLLLQGVMAAVGVYLLYHNKRHLTIDPAGHSPFTTVYKVLKYAWQHKCPENRSAFTYWEEDIPPRIDLGKSKYGGPFTTEEVEDTKTLFRILLLLFSLFGLHLVDNGFSVTTHLIHKLCPSAVTFMTVFLAPNVISSVSIVISVPVLHYVILPHFNRYIPNMLHRMGLSMAVILLQEVAGILIVLQAAEDYANCSHHKTFRDCYFVNTPFLISNTCTTLDIHNDYCGQGDTLFLWTLLPIALRSFAYQFAFMTALEFICAQAPLRMKGLLIGLWYAISALQIHSIDNLFLVEDSQWFISHGVKCSLILLSLLLYCCVAKHYHYRVRDEVVPIYFLIEERYEREFQLRDEYEREQREEKRALMDKPEGPRCSRYGSQ